MIGSTTITVGYQGNFTGSFLVTVVDETDPIADAGSDQTVKAGEIIQFDGTGSSDNVGIDTYEWTFTDGDNTLALDGDKVEYTFEEPGTYEITLEVTDENGNFDSDSFFVIVEEKEKNGEEDISWLIWLVLVIVLIIVVMVFLLFLMGKKKGKQICKECGRDFHPQTDEEAAAGVCPVCKGKEVQQEPVEAIIEEVAPVEDEELMDSTTPTELESESPDAPEEALLQTVQCPECNGEFSARSKTPGLMAVTCPHCGTKGEIEF
jgi:PKD repeat protein